MKANCFAFVISLLFFVSCESENAEPVNTLGSEVELSMSEFIEQDSRTLTLKFLTLKDFPCINYRIKHQLYMDEQSVRVVLQEVEASDICLDAIGPAAAFVEIGNLEPKDYNLSIQLGESIINSGTLSVSKESYQINLAENQGIQLLNPDLNRIPQQAVWGQIKFPQSEDYKEFMEFFNSTMEVAGASSKKFAEGDYGYFKVAADGKISQPLNAQEKLVEQAFLLDFSGDREDLQMVMQQINTKYKDVQIRLYNARGEELRNWDLQ
jgi:hypothetical protein